MASISEKHEELLRKLLNKRDGNRLYTYAALADLFAIGCWLYIEKKGNIASKIHLTVFRAIIENLGDCKESKK